MSRFRCYWATSKLMLLALTLALISLAGISRGEADTNEEVARARTQLARAKAGLAHAEALLAEAQARTADKDQARLIAVAMATVERQRQALQQTQDRLDLLLGCIPIKVQLDQDMQVLKRQQDRIAAGLAELKEWTRQNEQAQLAACQSAADAILEGTLLTFINSFEAKVAQAEAKLRAMPTNRVDRWHMEEIVALRIRIDRLKVARDGFKIGHATLSAMELWRQLHELSQSAHLTAAEISDHVRKFAGNSVVQEAIEATALVAAANDFEKRLLKENFPLVTDSVKLGNLLVDYSYEAVRWAASRNRIVQQYQLTEQELAAVAAVSCQVERSVHRLHICRGVPAPALSGRCQAREK